MAAAGEVGLGLAPHSGWAVLVGVVDLGQAATGMPGRAIEALAKAAGRELGSPWGADQKSAALMAWLVLKTGARSAAR